MAFRTWALALCFGANFATAAFAHPHVFIDARAGFKFNAAGELEALRVTWIYDAFTSLQLIAALDLDQDNDGILSEADLDRVVLGQTVWPDDFDGDVHLESGGAPVAMGRPENGAAEMSEFRISVSFDLPLAAPMTVKTPMELRLYDPTYYYDYSMIDVSGPETCGVEVIPFSPDGATFKLQATLALLSREETPEQENVGRLFADIVVLTCD